MTSPAARLRALLDEVAFLKRRRGDDAIRQRACEAEISAIRYKHGDLEMRRPDDRFLCERFARAGTRRGGARGGAGGRAGGRGDGRGRMKTWRERVAEAKARGSFNADDYSAWGDAVTCPAGEAAIRYGLSAHPTHETGEPNHGGAGRQSAALLDPVDAKWCAHFGNDCLWLIGDDMFDAMGADAFGRCHRLLDEIDDKALALKREASHD